MAHRTLWSERVAARVRRAIDASELSERQISEQTGIPLTTLRRRRDGANGDTWRTIDLDRLARALGMDPFDLLPQPSQRRQGKS